MVKDRAASPSGQEARLKGRYGLVVGYLRLRAELLSPSAQVQFLVNRNHATLLPTRTLARSKVPERATLSAPCGALSPWPSAIGLHGDTTTLVTEWGWRCASWFFEPPLTTYVPHVGTPPVWVQHQGKVQPPLKTYFPHVANLQSGFSFRARSM